MIWAMVFHSFLEDVATSHVYLRISEQLPAHKSLSKRIFEMKHVLPQLSSIFRIIACGAGIWRQEVFGRAIPARALGVILFYPGSANQRRVGSLLLGPFAKTGNAIEGVTS